MSSGDDDELPAAEPYWRQMVSTFCRSKTGLVGLAVLILIVLFAWVGPVFYHTNQTAANLLLENQAPSAQHVLGTTPEGQDELGALDGGRTKHARGGPRSRSACDPVRTCRGALAGYVGGFIDSLMMRIVDALLSIPFLFFVVLLASMVTPSLLMIILVIGAVSWLSTARLARGCRRSEADCDVGSEQRPFSIPVKRVPHSRGLIVPQKLIGEMTELVVIAAERQVVGDPLEESTDLGPLVSEAQLRRVRNYIQRASTKALEY